MGGIINPIPPILTPLAANGVFTSPWFDTLITQSSVVTLSSISDQASVAQGVVIQQTSDPNQALLTSTIATATATANVALTLTVTLGGKRFWRFQYTNGATAQTLFDLGVSSSTTSTTSLLTQILVQTQILNFNIWNSNIMQGATQIADLVPLQ